MKTLDAIAAFLRAQAATHHGPDLLARWTPDLETQVNVSPGNGQRVGKSTWSDGVRKWWNIRIPKGANSVPVWEDYELSFPLEWHAEAIGSTGWDWVAKWSRWVGFDFDSIVGHAAGVGIEPAELDRIGAAAAALPWVEVRRSTRGKGLHLYVFVDQPTANHTEHAALGRAVLARMSAETGFDFRAAVDTCGGNLWIWHRGAENGGLGLVKPADGMLLDVDWSAHLDVVKRKRSKVAVSGDIEKLAAGHKLIPLDAEHRATIEALGARGVVAEWVNDHGLLQTHTAGLAMLTGVRGVYRTLSTGSDLSEANCFAFPLPDGAWRVLRFSQGAREADTWTQDGHGWTHCLFNSRPDLRTAAVAFGGVEITERGGGYQFTALVDAIEAIRALGHELDVDASFNSRQAVLKAHTDGRLIVNIERFESDELVGWHKKGQRKPLWWGRILDVQTATVETVNCDEMVRVMVTPQGHDAGVWLRTVSGWCRQSLTHAKYFLQSKGHDKPTAETLLGCATDDPWQLVSLPFQPEYPGGRRWNMGAPQLAFEPADRDAELDHPHWDLILDHVGQSLDEPLARAPWGNVKTGGDYLRAIFAAILREPFTPTPYLFCFGPENSGKSILHEAFGLLVTSGVVPADRALTSQNDFNGELAGAIMCVVEEKNIAKTPGALNKIKDAVTSRTLSIRRMRTDSYTAPNSTHWVQCSNDEDAAPIFPGDTRITMLYVPPPAADIPKGNLLERLRLEAPAFLRTLIDLDLPPATGRLRVPVVETAAKLEAADRTSPLSVFLRERCTFTGQVSKAELFNAWQTWCEDNGQVPGSNVQFGIDLRRLVGDRVKLCNMRVAGKLVGAYRGVTLDPAALCNAA